MTATTSDAPKRGLAAYLQPKTFTMLVLGFSSGLPFLLVGNTLGYWLRDEGTSLAAIGFLSWVGFAYSMKFLWAPIIAVSADTLETLRQTCQDAGMDGFLTKPVDPAELDKMFAEFFPDETAREPRAA